MRKAIGVDLGGTFIKAGVVDAKGRVLSHVKRPTQAELGRMAVIRNIAAAAEEAREIAGVPWRDIQAVGLGSPGVFEGTRRIVRHSPNLKCLQGQELAAPLGRILPARVPVPVLLENDANVAAYAESWVGAGRDVSTLALFTLGTGVGGGIVLNGRIWQGAWGTAAELGHQNLFPDGVVCGCGNRGCLEAYASATALVRRFKEAVASGRPSRLAARARSGEEITARDIHLAARARDRTCCILLQETGRYLGIAVMNTLHILNVEMVVFAGGMTGAGSLLLNAIRKEAKARTIPLAFRNVRILFSRLGDDAGLIGAAGWALAESRADGKAGQ